MHPPDHTIRERFTTATDINMSLECPAGSGKTYALTSRIDALSKRHDATRVLSSLVVVTYTRKAADEIQQRARAALVAGGASPAVQQAFNRVFFGTIHSFAVELLRNYGHFIGVPSVFDVVEDTESLWMQFLHSSELAAVLKEPEHEAIARYVPMQTVFALARRWDFARCARPEAVDAPRIDFSLIHGFPLPKRAAVAENIRRTQQEFRRFEEAIGCGGDAFVSFPRCYSTAKEFVAAVQSSTASWRKWIACAVAALAHRVGLAFRAYRISKGALCYDDQVQMAVELLRNAQAAAVIRARGFRILLDEAQDTDPSQFEFLIESVRPVCASGHWSTGQNLPEPGRFVMTGDGQQSIYGDRADLATYRKVHEYITRDGVGEALAFDVTFRCGRRIIDVANLLFPAVLNGENGQVPYIPLRAKPAAPEGQVVKLTVPRPAEGIAEATMATAEAQFLARWLKEAGLAKLRARAWGQVAILCPRKRWFPLLRDALRSQGIESQLLSTRLVNADSPAYAWFAAVAYSVVYPRDGYELAGVLREVFGVSDHDIANFTRGDGTKLQIESVGGLEGSVGVGLNKLASLRRACDGLPLRTQTQIIADMLRPRLAVLPLDTDALFADLDRILLASAEAEAGGRTLHEFVESLLADWEKIPDEPEDPHKLSIITNLRSKGLEWDAVVVPFLFRPQREPAPAYPRFIGRRNGDAQVAMSSDEVSDDERRASDVASLQELQRVMYVTCTRARHTLVLLDDRDLFEETSAFCAADGLAVKTANAAVWDTLTDSLTPADGEQPELPARPIARSGDSFDLCGAQERAREFPRLIRPSQLITTGPRHEDPEARGPEDSKFRGSALDYGIWWHETMRGIDWRSSVDAWTKDFNDRLAVCPDADRARTEWQTFLASELAALLSSAGAIVITEAPCFIPLPESGIAVDGIMDLAVFLPAKKRWLVADWKTTAHEDALAYAPQINTYRETLQAATGFPADGAVYFTQNGSFTRLDAAA